MDHTNLIEIFLLVNKNLRLFLNFLCARIGIQGYKKQWQA
jgi:hypothetical protein